MTVKYQLNFEELKGEKLEAFKSCLDDKFKKAVEDAAISEAERRDKICLLEMGMHYAKLREAADELMEAAKHPILNFRRLKKARLAYDLERTHLVYFDAHKLFHITKEL